MKKLTFIVDGNHLNSDPTCNFSGLFPGANRTIRAEFILPPEWKNGVKVVAFRSMLGTEYPARALDRNDSCDIPGEALNMPAFRIQLLRKYRGEVNLTKELTVYQKGGRV